MLLVSTKESLVC